RDRAADHLAEEGLLVAEVAVDGALGRVGHRGDLVDARPEVPVVEECAERGLHDLAPLRIAANLRRARLSAWHRRPPFAQVNYTVPYHCANGMLPGESHFDGVVISRTVWVNLPPALVYHCRRPGLVVG